MYKLITNLNGEVVAVFRIADSAAIPMSTANTDYQAYIAWVEAGNSPIPADQPNKET
jgi:hypothetical protein